MSTRKPEWSLLTPWRSILASAADGELATHEQALEAPSPHIDEEPLAVIRSFAFVDISGFTAFCDRHGEQRAIEVLALFRDVTRTVAARRGVRVAKWLGDGVMLVGLDPAVLAAAVSEIVLRCEPTGLDTHAGMATGAVLLFEGDDYVGRPVNLAARLCDHAPKGHVLAVGPLPGLPVWLSLGEVELVEVAGVDALVEVQSLDIDDDLRGAFLGAKVA